MKYEVKIPKVKKKKATQREIRELKEMVIEIQQDPVAMKQIRRFIAQTV